MFRLILIIYGEKDTKKYISKFMQDNLRNYMSVNLTKIDFSNRLRKLNSQTETLISNSSCCSKKAPFKNVQLWRYLDMKLFSTFQFQIVSILFTLFFGRPLDFILIVSTVAEKLVELYTCHTLFFANGLKKLLYFYFFSS